MQKILIDANNTVVNIIEWASGSDYTPPDGLTLVDAGDGAAIGGTYDPKTKTFTPPTPPDPPAEPPTADQFAALQSAVQTLTLQVLANSGA